MIKRWQLNEVLVTLGERGAFGCDGSGPYCCEAGTEVPGTDTLGSGDAFSSGYMHRRLTGASLSDCAEHGNRLGTLVVTRRGATESVVAKQIDSFSALPPIADPRFT